MSKLKQSLLWWLIGIGLVLAACWFGDVFDIGPDWLTLDWAVWLL